MQNLRTSKKPNIRHLQNTTVVAPHLASLPICDTVWKETLAVGNVGEFGKSPVIRQTKTIQISTYN